MNADQIEIAARRSASQVRQAAVRAALAEQFRQAAALALGTEHGLALAAESVGLRTDRGIAAHLQLVQMVLGELADAIAAGDVFYTHEEHRAIDAERAEFAAQLADNPAYLVTRSRLDQIEFDAVLEGAQRMQAEYA